MSDLAPLIVEPPAETKTAVAETLEGLEVQLASVHAITAEAYASQGDYENAHKHVEIAVQMQPDDPRYQNQVGYLRYLTGDDGGAVRAFCKVIDAIPDQVDAICNLGMVFFGLENWAEAKEWFTRAAQIQPNDAEIWNNLGAAIFQCGSPQQAVPYFRKALEIDPHNEDAKANLASC
ncbi:MAG: tetratricopeptide repeat protein [Planctomycetes bacterium]|nr:tetratricopeptide repeat protein [Planctomycetota bacterium]